jgi:hypothetical protein
VDEVFVYSSQSNFNPGYTVHDNFLINLRFKIGVIARVLAAFGLVEPPLPMLGLGVYCDRGSVINDQLVLDKVPGQPIMKLSFGNERGHGRESRPWTGARSRLTPPRVLPLLHLSCRHRALRFQI